MSAEITLSGIGYDYLYMGTAAEAAGNESQWIGCKDEQKSYIENGEEKTGRSYIIQFQHWIPTSYGIPFSERETGGTIEALQ